MSARAGTIDRAALDVLATAAEIGLVEAAHVPASVYDPFFRPFIRRKVAAAIERALARTERKAGDHVLRLAFLGAHPAAPPDVDPNDERAVAAAFEPLAKPFLPARPETPEARGAGAYRAAAADRAPGEIMQAPPRRRRKFWPVTTSLGGGALAAALVVGAVLAIPYLTPTPQERFERTAFGAALGEPLTDVVVYGGRRSDEGGAARERALEGRAALVSPAVRRQIGDDAYAALTATLDVVPVASTSEAEGIDEALAPLFAEVNALDAKLADARVPALLHAYATGEQGRRNVWLTSYFVAERADVTIGGRPYRVAWGRRLDSLNLKDSTVYKATAEEWTIVSLDHADQLLLERVVRPIATGRIGAVDYDEGDTSAVADLARAELRAVTEETTSALGASLADVRAMNDAVDARNAALDALQAVGYEVEQGSRIHLTPAQRRGLARVGDRGTYAAKLASEALRLEGRMKLVDKPLAKATSELARLLEEQFLGRVAEELAIGDRPEAVPGYAIATARGDTYARTKRGLATAAGELATLARSRAAPRLALGLLVANATEKSSGYWEAEPARFVLEPLFVELGLGTFDGDGWAERFRRAAIAALALPPERVRDAAGRVYPALFGHPVPELSRVVRK